MDRSNILPIIYRIRDQHRLNVYNLRQKWATSDTIATDKHNPPTINNKNIPKPIVLYRHETFKLFLGFTMELIYVITIHLF